MAMKFQRRFPAGTAVWVPNYSASTPFVEAIVVEIRDTTVVVDADSSYRDVPHADVTLRADPADPEGLDACGGDLSGWRAALRHEAQVLHELRRRFEAGNRSLRIGTRSMALLKANEAEGGGGED